MKRNVPISHPNPPKLYIEELEERPAMAGLATTFAVGEECSKGEVTTLAIGEECGKA